MKKNTIESINTKKYVKCIKNGKCENEEILQI